MIEIRKHTLLAAYGDRAINVSVLEREDNLPEGTKPGMRVFDVFETNKGPKHPLWLIELSANQEAARVTKVSTEEQRVFLCANNRSAEELFEHGILSAAEAYMTDD